MNLKKTIGIAILSSLAYLCGASTLAECPSGIDVKGDKSLQDVSLPPATKCSLRTTEDGYSLPDPNCTPGAYNPTVTVWVLTARHFKASCLRNQATAEKPKKGDPVKGTKEEVYAWYGIDPKKNCELNYLVPLELGGADTLDNVWPECAPKHKKNASYKEKRDVDIYVTEQVKSGHLNLDEARQGIASDWTRFLPYLK